MSIEAGSTGKCPHCGIVNRFEETDTNTGYSGVNIAILQNKGLPRLRFHTCTCTSCGKVIIFLDDQMLYPLGSQRQPAPSEVPEAIARDFNEACLLETLSKKASTALARRCLQNLLHEQGIKDRNLSLEIDTAMKNLPSALSESIDSIRNIGNFAAHPIKSLSTGEIVEVEEGETEWTLDTLEDLFDYYYVQPCKIKSRRDALNAKLDSAGKPQMK